MCAGDNRRRGKRTREHSPQGADEWQVASSSGSGPISRAAAGPASSGSKPASTWELALAFWDLEDRPTALQCEATVNTMTLAEVFAFKEHYTQQIKKEGKGESTFGRDRRPPLKKFKAGEDDCAAHLHPARFERGPVVELTDYWKAVPLRHANTFRHLPLEHAGAANEVNECVIARAHDRTLPLRIRMFVKGNHSKKGFTNTSSEGKEPADSWDYPREFLELQMALNLLAEVYANLWPADPTPRLLWKVMIHYQYANGYGSERERCRLMEQFCDEILRESAGRANRGKTPLSFRQLKERWRDLTEKVGKSSNTSSNQSSQGNKSNYGGARSNGGSGGNGGNSGGGQNSNNGAGKGKAGKSTRGGVHTRSGALRHQGNLICYLYNNRGPGCQRAPATGGCDDGKGGVYAHVCNFDKGGGVICAAAHPRCKNH